MSYAGRVAGSQARLSCDQGYQLTGPVRLVCQMDLQWQPALSSPACRPVLCPSLPTPSWARLSVDNTAYQAVANYTCLPGYDLRVCTCIYLQPSFLEMMLKVGALTHFGPDTRYSFGIIFVLFV